MLRVEGINVFYGNIHALHDVSFNVKENEIVSLIGANGSGKSSTLNTISSLIKPRAGCIEFLGENITKIKPEKIVKKGLIQVPEGRRVFANLNVMDNLKLGAYTRKNKAGIAEDLKMVFDRFPRLQERRKQISGNLSGGEQQMLAMGRALMSRPKLLLLDEPSMGLAPLLVREIFDIIKDINENGTTILLVEQNANMALSIADRAYILETGKVINDGSAKELLASDEVKKAYLGG